MGEALSPPFIVKIQRPLFTNEEEPKLLVYNKNRSVQVTWPVNSPEGHAIVLGYFLEHGGDRLNESPLKVYVEATLDDHGMLKLGEPVDEQDW